jgi:predicted RNA polymerase sigma factor
MRLFLPNYLDTFRELLKRDAAYSNLIGNRGTVLELLGRGDEARRHIDEASEFLPHDNSQKSVRWITARDSTPGTRDII